MKTLDLEQMENIEAGGFVAGFCGAVGAVSFAAGITGAINFWNPVGWAAWSLIAIDAGCIIYGISNA